MKKFLLPVFSLLGVPVFADEANTLIDSSAVISNMNTMKTDLVNWSTSFMPIIAGIVGVFIVYWLFKFAIRLIKSFASTSK